MSVAPGKRPLSTITPTIIEGENNKLEMAVGGSGGSQILTATLNVKDEEEYLIYVFRNFFFFFFCRSS